MTGLTDKDFQDTASLLGCEVAAIKAVYDVETAGRGYLTDGRVKILFEGHRFWKGLQKAGINPAHYTAGYENVLYPKWDKTQYKGGSAEWDRMSKAIEVCKNAGVSPDIALGAASYGSFQIMGENAQLCGYHNAHEMLADYNTNGEPAQLKSFAEFVINTHLDDELRARNWAAFAKGYNGTQYRENQYDIKIQAAYNKNK